MPWDLTKRQRRLLNLRGRDLVQTKPVAEPVLDGRVEGIHVGDLVLLAALRRLADQGNMLAGHLAERLAIRLSIDRRTRSYRKD